MPKVLRTFHDAPSRRVVRAGDTIEATPERHDELALQGLVEPRAKGSKVAASHLNKMDEQPEDKVLTVEVLAPVKRGPGRPTKKSN
jgi:hypothetical protein